MTCKKLSCDGNAILKPLKFVCTIPFEATNNSDVLFINNRLLAYMGRIILLDVAIGVQAKISTIYMHQYLPKSTR